MNVLHEAELILKFAQHAEAIQSVKECSWCGCPMPEGGELGCVFEDKAYSFCSHDCYGQWGKENDPCF